MVAEIADTFRLIIVRLMTHTDSFLRLIHTNILPFGSTAYRKGDNN